MNFINKNILIVEDDLDLSFITSDVLKNYGYNVTCANTTEDAYNLLAQKTFHLLLLDINLPTESGFDFCREIRKFSSLPIIFISARTSENDKIVGLDLGGDDYLAKPYSLKELLSRVNSLMRRSYGFTQGTETISFGNIEINPDLRIVKKNSIEIPLSLKEFDLLLFLSKNKNKSLKKEAIFNEVWGPFNEIEPSTVSVHIRWLREKLKDDPSSPKLIKTIWGIGYSLICGEEK